MLATEYAGYYEIAPQSESETDSAFKSRVASALRAMGNIIEAHEALQDKRFDEDGGNNMVMAGITGAVAMALQGRNYGATGDRLLGDEIAAGIVATAPRKPDMSGLEMIIMLAMMEG